MTPLAASQFTLTFTEQGFYAMVTEDKQGGLREKNKIAYQINLPQSGIRNPHLFVNDFAGMGSR